MHEAVWTKPSKGEEILAEVAERNKELFELERVVEKKG